MRDEIFAMLPTDEGEAITVLCDVAGRVSACDMAMASMDLIDEIRAALDTAANALAEASPDVHAALVADCRRLLALTASE